MSSSVVPLRRPGRPAFDQANRETADRFRDACRRASLSKTSKTPLWQQVCDRLERIIEAGVVAPNSRIPSEQALAEMFGVSRPVIRNALQTLAAKGLVVKVHRKGVFVGAPPLQTDFLTSNLSVYDDIVSRGHKIDSDTFLFERTTPNEDERNALQLEPGETVVRIGRVFWLNGRAITYTHMSLHGGRLPGFETLDIEDRSVLGLVRERYGLRLNRVERWFEATLAPPDVAKAMDAAVGTPMIMIESIAHDTDNMPLEYYRAYYNSQIARMHLSISD